MYGNPNIKFTVATYVGSLISADELWKLIKIIKDATNVCKVLRYVEVTRYTRNEAGLSSTDAMPLLGEEWRKK